MATISTIQFKRGKKDALERVLVGDSKPLAGEPIFELDSNKFKIGDGAQDYKDLPYVAEGEIPGDGQLVFKATKFEFPSVGTANKLYVAMEENNIYFWNNKYILAGIDSREIDAGGADADASYSRGTLIK